MRMKSASPTDTSSTQSLCTMNEEQCVLSRQESDLQSDLTSSDGCCSWMECINLSYVATESFRRVEQRTIEAHKQLWSCARTAHSATSANQYTVVLPKLRYKPRLPRTGSTVMLNWCTLGSVATSATVESSLSQTEASLNLANHDEHCEEEEEELLDTAHQQSEAQRPASPCQWGYFVDSASPPPTADRNRAPHLSTPARARASPSYRRFMSREIEASARYGGFDRTEPAEMSREKRMLHRVEAQPNLLLDARYDS